MAGVAEVGERHRTVGLRPVIERVAGPNIFLLCTFMCIRRDDIRPEVLGYVAA
jgi:hypothetical protein